MHFLIRLQKSKRTTDYDNMGLSIFFSDFDQTILSIVSFIKTDFMDMWRVVQVLPGQPPAYGLNEAFELAFCVYFIEFYNKWSG